MMPQNPDIVRKDFPGSSIRSQLLDIAIRSTVKTIVYAWSKQPHLPWPYGVVDFLGLAIRPITIPRTAVRLPHCTGEFFSPRSRRVSQHILYLHGGAFLVGGRHLHSNLAGRFAERLQARVLTVAYRKLPKYSVAQSVSDCVDGYKHLLAAGANPDEITLMGDSAGGYLVFMTAIEIRQQNLPMPRAIVAISPLTDWDFARKLESPTSATCAIFPRAVLPIFQSVALAAATGGMLESPLQCNLAGLPPTLIQASSSEMVYPDAVAMAEALTMQGVQCELQVWHRQVHVFQAAASIVPEAKQAVGEIEEFIHRHVTGQQNARSA